MSTNKRGYKDKNARRHQNVVSEFCRKEEKAEDPELHKYRDRAKERREDQNPDYEITELTSFHAVAPPGTVDLFLSCSTSCTLLSGDVEHTHLVKGLDYALLHKVRSEIDKKPDVGEKAEDKTDLVIYSHLTLYTKNFSSNRGSKDDQPVAFRTAMAKSIHQWTVKPQTLKINEMFLPGRMAFVFNTENLFSQDIPTTVHRSKDDCPVPEEMVKVSVDGSVLDRIAKIMTYLRLGSSGKVLKKKKKDKDTKGTVLNVSNVYEDNETMALNNRNGRLNVPPPPPPPRRSHPDDPKVPPPAAVRIEEDDIFVGDGVDYSVPSRDMSRSPISEDMEESPRNKAKSLQFEGAAAAYGPVPPADFSTGWQHQGGYPGEWQHEYGTEQVGGYQGQYQPDDMEGNPQQQLDPRLMTQEEKDRGLGSVFKRDDQRLQQLRERDSREKDPNFISESYSECYPGYQEYNREVVDSDEDEGDLTKMDMGGRAKGRLHRWDFETEEEWAKYNEQKEAMPKAAFQFGVKMQDGRKTRKQNRDQKLTNDLHKINQILAKKKAEKGGAGADRNDAGEPLPAKKLRI
ncbi:hypothetical protein M569_08542 [Genlisea aurea]|uniref:RED-like N-terminal domain-containing protein n=1 Tax=Genlisea aurea TaxID=192259 RepID=S8DSR9_9LAMI|nr:hypothetical protein M569_08542 [Genlisea aurea]